MQILIKEQKINLSQLSIKYNLSFQLQYCNIQMKAEIVIKPIQEQLHSNQLVYKQNNPAVYRPNYSNHAMIDQSIQKLWRDVYQYPQKLKFLSLNHTQPIKSELASKDDPSSYKFSWDGEDPEKKHPKIFDVFNVNKITQSNKYHNQLEPFEQSVKQVKMQTQQLPQYILNHPSPQAFMGAFGNVQSQFSCFGINILLPNLKQNPPFSQIIEMTKKNQSMQIQNPYAKQQNNSQILKDLNFSRQRQERKYFFQIQSVISQQQGKQIQGKQQQLKQLQNLDQSEIVLQKQVFDQNLSILWNYQSLMQPQGQFNFRNPTWEQKDKQPSQLPGQSQIFEVSLHSNAAGLHLMEMQLSLLEDTKKIISDKILLIQISKMLQNIQCQLFTLNYQKMQWSLDIGHNRFQSSLRGSLEDRLKSIIQMATYRSRLDVALQFIRKDPRRKIYFELGNQISQILIVFEELILDFTAKCSLVECLISIQKLSIELTLLYRLTINYELIEEQNRSYQNFNIIYLNSEFIIFKQVMKLTRFSDNLELAHRPMILKLANAVFKPILIILNGLLFQQAGIIAIKDQVYLKYYFQNIKDVLLFVSRKLALIKQESNQLYLICTLKEQLQLHSDLQELQNYQHKWGNICLRKRKLIERVKNGHRRKLRYEREKKHEQRMKNVYEMKNKVYQQGEQQNVRKKVQHQKNRLELQKLKKQIESSQQRRKLLQQLQKQKQRGLLLDLQLREKQMLGKQKEHLKKELQRVSQSDIDKGQELNQMIDEQKSVFQLSLIQRQKLQNKEMEQEINQRNNGVKYLQKDNIDQKLQKQIKKDISKSQERISSKQSINQPLFMLTSDQFMKRKSSKPEQTKTQSYFRLLNNDKDKDHLLQNDQQSDSSQLSKQQQIEYKGVAQQLQINRQVDTSTCLQICINDVIKKQMDIIENSLRFLVLQKYEVMSVINFMRQVFLSGNGQRIQQFIRLSINTQSQLNLKHFTECLLFDSAPQLIHKLSPSFYHSRSQNLLNTEISIFDDNVQNYIGFQFKNLPVILEPYFSYIHLSKYMQIFGFVLRLRYCEYLVSSSWKLLNNHKRQIERRSQQQLGRHNSSEFQLRLLNRIYVIRYIIENFLITFQNYLFFRVIQKQYKLMKLRMNQLNQLQANHIKMLDNIIKYGFIDNSTQNLSKNFRKMLNYIQQFHNIVHLLVIDDLPSYMHEQVQKKIQFIHITFRKEHKNIQNLLFKVQ